MARRNPLGDAASIILAFLGAAAAAGAVYAVAKPAAPVTKSKPRPPASSGKAPMATAATPAAAGWTPATQTTVPLDAVAALEVAAAQLNAGQPTPYVVSAAFVLPSGQSWLQYWNGSIMTGAAVQGGRVQSWYIGTALLNALNATL